MDQPCALPTPTFPYAHHQHLYGKSQQSLETWKVVPDNTLHSHILDDENSPTKLSPHAHGRSLNRHSSHLSNINTTPQKQKPIVAGLDDVSRSARRQSAYTPEPVTPRTPRTPRTPYLPPGGHQRHHENHSNDHDHDHDHDHNHSHSHSQNHHHLHNHDHDRKHSHSHSHDHSHSHSHSHDHGHSHENPDDRSIFTKTLLPYTARIPLIHAILVEKDSRRIFYFMTLNFAFMTVQAFYGYLTDSLGLLSDSIHMFFDCVALLVGLVAAVMSKWPPSQRFPFGFRHVETLSGFANGILLMLLSVEIAFEAFERLWDGTKTKRLGELLIVSSLGLAVNLVGMMSFGHHHHHGHDHGQNHSHGHGHGHSHDHGDGHKHSHESNDSHSHSHSHSHGEEHKDSCAHGHGHVHDNENMYGIYLHIMADTLGSVSVIVSTVLTSIWGWSGWDPLASCFIAVLIFMSAVPLVLSSAKRLLLTVPEGVEYNLRNTLAGIGQQRGVVMYSAPRFWMDDGAGAGEKMRGTVHVTAGKGANLDETKDRVSEYLRKEGVSATVQVERDGDAGCWCARTRHFSTTPKKPEAF